MYEIGDDEIAFEDVTVVGGTDKALLIELSDGSQYWIPQSQITDSSEVYEKSGDASRGTLVITKWFAKKERLV